VIAAIVFVCILGLLVLFQLALAFGAPWGRFAWGGKHQSALPTGLRIASAASVIIYALLAVIALDRAGVIEVLPAGFSQVAMWVVFAYLALGIVMNAISRSKHERFTMTPVAIVLAVLALVIALGAAPGADTNDQAGGREGYVDAVHRGIPETLAGIDLGESPWDSPSVHRLGDGRFALITWGSSSCPAIVSDIVAKGTHALELYLQPSGGTGPCTADMAATTYEIVLPESVVGSPVAVTVTHTEFDDVVDLVLE
jgi:hypothetical protein